MPNLPAVPEHLVNQALSISENLFDNLDKLITDPGGLTPSDIHIGKDGKQYSFRGQPRFSVGKEWEDWVSKNISDQWSNTGVTRSYHVAKDGVEDSCAAAMHTDGYRAFCLFYIIKKDNDDQWTRWYRPVNGPLVAHKKMAFSMPPTTGEKFIKVNGEMHELVDEVCMPLNTWFYTDVRVLHQAGNHLGDRVGLQVSFSDDVFNMFDRTNDIDKDQQ